MGNLSNSGSKEVDLKIRHSNLSNAKLVIKDGAREIKNLTFNDQKEYDKWVDSLSKYKTASRLFLPISHSFSHTSLCGTAGTVEVALPSRRPTTTTIPIYFMIRSKIV